MQLTFNTRKILPTAYEGKNGIGFNTTIFSPVQYGIRFFLSRLCGGDDRHCDLATV